MGICHSPLQGAFWGLVTGLMVGTVRMVLEFIYTVPSCGQEDLRPLLVAKVHYLYFALILLGLTCLVITAVSLATPPIPKVHVRMQLTHTRTNSLHLQPHLNKCNLVCQLCPCVNVYACAYDVYLYMRHSILMPSWIGKLNLNRRVLKFIALSVTYMFTLHSWLFAHNLLLQL